MPEVSIIMNCYNSDKYLKEAIDSVYAQTYSDWEIIFWDNQSTDNSANIAKSYDERLKYYYAGEFLPLSAARNKALGKAQGEYIAFLDADDMWLPDKLEKQIDVFENQPDIGFIYCNFRTQNTQLKTEEPAYSEPQPGGDIFLRQISLLYSIGTLTVMFKSKLLSNVLEWFDSNLNISADFDFFLRLLKVSNAYYIEDPMAVYRIHESSTTKKQWNNYYNEMRYVINKLLNLYIQDDDEILNALRSFAKDIDMMEAKECLLNGDSAGAAELFAKHKILSKKEKVLYMLIKLPWRLSENLYNIYIRTISKF